MSIKLHNHVQTHLDEYSGETITTTGKPSVRDKLYGFKIYGKTVQNGTPTPESPVPIQSVPSSFDITSCGKNLWRNNRTFPFTQGGYTVDFEPVTGVYTINGTGGGGQFLITHSTPLCSVKVGDKITFRAEHISGTVIAPNGNPTYIAAGGIII